MPTLRMGTLNRDEIVRCLNRGELVLNARKRGDSYDIEAASYDLTAGTVVWKEPRKGDKGGDVLIRHLNESDLEAGENTLSLQPGQMVFVITKEEVKLPTGLCGTVYSRNKLAREGILALNAGHIDPGFQGPIVIRLINLRASPWPLKLGEPIFTIVFHTLCCGRDDDLPAHHPLSREETLRMVRASAAEGLSNALFELYASDMRERLLEHYAQVEHRLRDSFGQEFLRKGEFDRTLRESIGEDFIQKKDFGNLLLDTLKTSVIAWLGLFSVIATIVATGIAVVQVLKQQPPAAAPSPSIYITVPSTPSITTGNGSAGNVVVPATPNRPPRAPQSSGGNRP